MGEFRFPGSWLTHKNDDVSPRPRVDDPRDESGKEIEMIGSQTCFQPFGEFIEIAGNGDCGGRATERLRISVLGDRTWCEWYVIVVRGNLLCVDSAN